MNSRIIQALAISLLGITLSACNDGGDGGIVAAAPASATVEITSLDVSSGIFTVTGANLNEATSISVSDGVTISPLVIQSQSSTSLTATASSAVNFLVGTAYNLLISSASATTGAAVTFTIPAASVTNAMLASTYYASTDAATANTASKLVLRDGSGNFSAGTITATLSGTATNVSGTVAVANGGTGTTSLAANGALVVNASGTAATVVAPGSQYNLLMSNGTSWASTAPTSSSTPNTIVKRDATGSFSINTLNASSVLSSSISGVDVYADRFNSTDTVNLIVGYQTGTPFGVGFYNTLVGVQAGKQATACQKNTLIGYHAGANIYGTYSNTYVGYLAGEMNSTGGENTYIGSEAGKLSTNSYSNTALGWQSGVNMTTGHENTLVGHNSAPNLTTGSRNIVIGESSGPQLATTAYNVMIGYSAGLSSTGNNNVCIGVQAQAYGALVDAIAIGNSANATASYSVQLGAAYDSTTSAKMRFRSQIVGDEAWIGGASTTASIDNSGNIIRTPSDARLKEDVKPLESALAQIVRLQGVSFSWKDKTRYGSKREIGFLAQELERVVPEVVATARGKDAWRSVNYGALTALLAEGIKEQQEEISSLRQQNRNMEERLARLEKLAR